MDVSITVDLKQYRTKQAKLVSAFDSQNLLKAIGWRLQGFVDESFKTAGRGKWRAIAFSTYQQTGPHNPLQLTGAYRRSFVVSSDGKSYVQIGSNMGIAKYHEFGTKPYIIRVRNAKSLAAKTSDGGYMFFGKEVRHPGVPPRPVLPTKSETENMVSEVVNGVFEKAIGE